MTIVAWAWGWSLGIPFRDFFRGNDRISQVSRAPQCPFAHVQSTPAGPLAPDHYGVAARPFVGEKQRLPRKVFRRSIAWLSDRLSTLSRTGCPAARQDSLPAAGQALFQHAVPRHRAHSPTIGLVVLGVFAHPPSSNGVLVSKSAGAVQYVRCREQADECVAGLQRGLVVASLDFHRQLGVWSFRLGAAAIPIINNQLVFNMRTPTRISLIVPIVAATLAVVLWFGWAWWVHVKFPGTVAIPPEVQQAIAARGQFGDLFGGVNALFTALLLGGAIYTVWLQHNELSFLCKIKMRRA